MPIINYSLANFPFFTNRARGQDPQGYSFCTALMHAVATRAVHSQNSTILAALQQALGASNYTLTAGGQGMGASCVFRFPRANAVLLVIAGLTNSTDNANMIRLSDFTALPALPTKLNMLEQGGTPYFHTAILNKFNGSYMSRLYTQMGYSTVSHTQGPNVAICGHGVGAAYGLLTYYQAIVDSFIPPYNIEPQLMPSSLFGMPNCANRICGKVVDDRVWISHYFNESDINITKPIQNRQVAFSGTGGFGQAAPPRTAPPSIRMVDISQRPVPAQPAGPLFMNVDYFGRVQQQAAPPAPVNGWINSSTIEAYVTNLFAVAVAPSNSSVVAQLQTINAMIDAIPYTMASTNPSPIAPVLPTAVITPQVAAPTNPSNVPIANIAPAPTLIGGQLTLRAVNLSKKVANAYQGYDRRLIETTLSALGNQLRRDDLQEFTNSVVPSNGSPIWDWMNSDLMNALDKVQSHLLVLLDQKNVSAT